MESYNPDLNLYYQRSKSFARVEKDINNQQSHFCSPSVWKGYKAKLIWSP